MSQHATSAEVIGPGTNESVIRLQHGTLRRSLTNPRKHFAPGPLHELARNIISLARKALAAGTHELGVQTPLFVRDVEIDGTREIIAGERRWRATELAMELVQHDADAPHVIERLSWLPVLLKSWDDDAVIEFQLIENLRRDDLTPIEEADGYQAMIARGNTPEQVAEKVGTSVDAVYSALKWARLPPLARTAFERGMIGKKHATMIARIPDARERRVATVLTLENNDYRGEGEFDDADLAAREKRVKEALDGDEMDVLPKRALAELIANDFMRSLVGVAEAVLGAELMPARFGQDGERLCGGACLDCPYRTGSSPLFKAEVAEMQSDKGAGGRGRQRGIDPNICTQPSCLVQKLELQWKREVSVAERAGMRVLDEKEMSTVFSAGSSSVKWGAEYVALEDKPDASLTGHGNAAKVKTWEELLEDTGVQVVLAQDGQGNPRKLVLREAAVMAVNEKYAERGKESPLGAAGDERVDDDKRKEEQRKRAEEDKRDKRAYSLALGSLMFAAKFDLDGWRLMARVALHQTGMDGLRALAAGLGVKPADPLKGETLQQGHYAAALIERYVETGTVSTLPAVVLTALVAQQAWRGLDSDDLKQACKHFNVSITEMKAWARDELKAKKKGQGRKPLRPGEKGVLVGAFDTGDSGALVEPGARTEPETVYAASGHYHCDVCGLVCEVMGDEIEEVEAMKHGEFRCFKCAGRDGGIGYEPLPDKQQKLWESWVPGDGQGYVGHASAVKSKGKAMLKGKVKK